jgi:hypothetical protein
LSKRKNELAFRQTTYRRFKGRLSVTQEPRSQRKSDVRAEIETYLYLLVDLYEKTDPSMGAASEEDKLANARDAIRLWWIVFDRLLLWAQSQIVGYHYTRSNCKYVEKLAKELNLNSSNNSHLLEYLGLYFAPMIGNLSDPLAAKVAEDMEEHKADLDEVTLRLIMRDLIGSKGMNSAFWRSKLSWALYALNYGSVEDILKPAPKKRQGDPMRLIVWKLRAIQHVYFKMGKGIMKEKALQEVADAIGQGLQTLRSWEKILREDEYLAAQIEPARCAGAWENELGTWEWEDLDHPDRSKRDAARDALAKIRRTGLKDISAGIRKDRQSKTTGAGTKTSDTKK